MWLMRKSRSGGGTLGDDSRDEEGEGRFRQILQGSISFSFK